MTDGSVELRIGWGEREITPAGPVLLRGQFHARVSEGVRDPITTTAMAIERVAGGSSADHVVMVSCDLVSIPDELRDGVRERLTGRCAGLDPENVFLSATHTHTAPAIHTSDETCAGMPDYVGIDLDVMDVGDYVRFTIDQVVTAVTDAWSSRRAGGVSWGMGHAVVGYNRRWVSREGEATMYGETKSASFSHIEGYEDHSVNLLFAWDKDRRISGVVVNLACPSQVSEQEYTISADFWHETRIEIRRRLGEGVFLLPQCSPAGDQSPRPIFRKASEERMLEVKGRTRREEIAVRIADAVSEVAQWMDRCVVWDPVLRHTVERVPLARNQVRDEEVEHSLSEASEWRARYEALRRALDGDPRAKDGSRWYVDVTRAYRRARWYERVALRKSLQESEPRVSVEVQAVRLGDVVFATNPFEYYLDYGIEIKARSDAANCFLVQLAGPGSYLPTERAMVGKGYGAVPASTIVGPQGGRELADRTVAIMNALWEPERDRR